MKLVVFAIGCVVLMACPSWGQEDYQYKAGEILISAARADEPKIEFSKEQAHKYLEDAAAAWTKERSCISCHTNGTYLFIRPSLSESFGKPSEAMRKFYTGQLKKFAELGARKLKRKGTQPAQVVYLAAGLAEWDAQITGKLSKETDQALRLMLKLQKSDGSLHSLDCWPPFESSAYQEATMAATAVGTAPGWLKSLAENDPIQENINRLKAYIRDTKPPHDYARVVRLWASLRLEGILSKKQQQEEIAMLQKHQLADGGWSIRTFAKPESWGQGNRAKKIRAEKDFASPASDGHMTGLALIVMLEAGVPSNDKQISKGVEWLKSNQRESGRWWTRSLNTDSWHYITYSGTAYAMLALQNVGQLD